MGAPAYEAGATQDELLHDRRIPHTFAIATTEVTAKQYEAFIDEFPGRHSVRVSDYSPDDQCPIMSINWYRAAEYCNWLSEIEGLDPVYVPNENGNYRDGMGFHEDGLKRNGYRLPTRAEWEYAVRAGTETTWSFGDSAELLRYYGWFVGNSNDRSWPVGTLKPNDFGLFDVHGNATEWLQPSRYRFVRGKREDRCADRLNVVRRAGGSCRLFHRDSRSANADRGFLPTTSFVDGGFRICRTFPW